MSDKAKCEVGCRGMRSNPTALLRQTVVRDKRRLLASVRRDASEVKLGVKKTRS